MWVERHLLSVTNLSWDEFYKITLAVIEKQGEQIAMFRYGILHLKQKHNYCIIFQMLRLKKYPWINVGSEGVGKVK